MNLSLSLGRVGSIRESLRDYLKVSAASAPLTILCDSVSQSDFDFLHENLKPAPFSLQEEKLECWCSCGSADSSLQMSFSTVPK